METAERVRSAVEIEVRSKYAPRKARAGFFARRVLRRKIEFEVNRETQRRLRDKYSPGGLW